MRATLGLVCLAVACWLLGPVSVVMAGVEVGQPVGEISVLDARDQPLEITNTKERTAIALVFLSSRSEAVDQSLAKISALYRKHRRLGVVYMGICSNDVETAAELGDYVRDRGLIFTIYRDPQATVAAKFGITEIPSVVLIDAEGRLIYQGGLESQAGQLALDAAVVEKIGSRAKVADIKPTPITQLGEKHKPTRNHGSLSFSSELIFEEIPEAAVYHCSTIAQAPNGDLLCLWYGGSYESSDDQTLFLARRAPGQRDWQPPVPLIRGPEPVPGNGVIFVDGHERVWIVWCRMDSVRPIGRGQGWDRCHLLARYSTDNGVTWSKDTDFVDNKLLAVPRNPPVLTSSGDLVLPLEAVVDGVEGSIFLIGEEGGKRWRQGGFTPGGSQPAVIERSDKSLFALMRKAPRLTQIESRDGGDHWTDAVASTLRNPDSGITMTRLANGHLVVIFNDTDTLRTPLSIARSIDEGRSWEPPLQLESNPGEYSYPCVIQTRDEKVHITYTYRRYSIKHVELNEDWLTHMERPN